MVTMLPYRATYGILAKYFQEGLCVAEGLSSLVVIWGLQRQNIADLGLERLDGGGSREIGKEERTVDADRRRDHLQLEGELACRDRGRVSGSI
jgi:hypothetical protein